MAHGDVAPGALLSEPESHSEPVQLPPLQPPGDGITPSVWLDPIFPLGATGLAQLSLPAAGGGVTPRSRERLDGHTHTGTHACTPPAWPYAYTCARTHVRARTYTHPHTTHGRGHTAPVHIHTCAHTRTHVCTRECTHRRSCEGGFPRGSWAGTGRHAELCSAGSGATGGLRSHVSGAVGGWGGRWRPGRLEAAVGASGRGASERSAEQKPWDWPAGQRSRGKGTRWPAGTVGQEGGERRWGTAGWGRAGGHVTCKEMWERDVAVGDQP